MQERIGEHPLWHVPYLPAPFSTAHADTIVVTWIAMGIVLIIVAVLAATHPVTKLSKRYSLMELIVSVISNQVETILGKNGVPFVPLIIALFVFIFVMNQIGLFPFVGRSPTADLNTTAALAVLVILLINGVGIARKGLGYYKHFVMKPLGLGIPLVPIMVIDELARPVTLAMRLFFNIFIGEILLILVAGMIAAHIPVISTLANGVPVLIYAFNMFVGSVQALVFTLLTIAYLITPTSDEAH